jgi:Protein of unknown function (DUF933)
VILLYLSLYRWKNALLRYLPKRKRRSKNLSTRSLLLERLPKLGTAVWMYVHSIQFLDASIDLLSLLCFSLFDILPVVRMKYEHGRFVEGPKPPKQLVSYSTSSHLVNSPLLAMNSFFLPSSDFENKFVCGEIMSYDDLREHGSETTVKAAGKLRQQGKPYESLCSSTSPFSLRNLCIVKVIDGDIAYWKAGG